MNNPSSCPHINEDTLTSATIHLLSLRENIFSASKNQCFVCAHCGLMGDLDLLKTPIYHQNHFQKDLPKQHSVCVRFSPPYGLYCLTCRDYQFSHSFDNMLTSHGLIKTKTTSTVSASAAVTNRGLCNMGATCFMNSILQVLLHNPAIHQCRQTQLASLLSCSLHNNNNNNNINNNNNNNGATPEPSLCICCEFLRLYCKMNNPNNNNNLCNNNNNNNNNNSNNNNNNAVVPSHLLFAVWRHADYMAGYTQQDAHEFLMVFISGVESHIKRYHNNNNNNNNNNDNINNNNINNNIFNNHNGNNNNNNNIYDNTTAANTNTNDAINTNNNNNNTNNNNINNNNNTNNNNTYSIPTFTEIFQGSIQSNLLCLKCKHASTKLESFLDLSLSVDNNNNSNNSNNNNSNNNNSNNHNHPLTSSSLQECLSHFTSVEDLAEQVFCQRCSQHTESQKQLSISASPPVLVMHIKRFDFFRGKKISGHLDFPITDLDITPFSAGGGGTNNNNYNNIKNNYNNSNNNSNNGNNSLLHSQGSSVQPSPRSVYLQQQQQLLQQQQLHLQQQQQEVKTVATTSIWESMTKNLLFSQSAPLQQQQPPPLINNNNDDNNSNNNNSNDYNNNNLYDLQGVVCHSGSLTQGHYISYVNDYTVCINPDNNNNNNNKWRSRWLRCDDEQVQEVSESEVLKSEAYILFYVKKSLLGHS